MILQVALVFVESVVLVNILHIRECLVRGIVALRLLVTVRRVALRHVDALIAFQNRCLAVVKVTASEVVVVIVGGVIIPRLTHAVVDLHIP